MELIVAPSPCRAARTRRACRERPPDSPPPGRRVASPPGSGSESDPPPDFDALVAPIVSDLVRLARRVLGDDLAWDAVQEALTGLWLRAEMPPNPRGWLLRAVLLRSFQIARSRRRALNREHRVSRFATEATDRDDPTRPLDLAEIRASLDGAIEGLEPPHRDVFRLWACEELDYATIADRLGIPIGTVRSRLHRAREAIRRGLARDLGEGDAANPARD